MLTNKKRHRVSNFIINHMRALCFALGEIKRAPLTNSLTIVVIAIALVLPSGLYRVLESLQPIGDKVSSQPKVTVYTKTHISDTELQQLRQSLQKIPTIATIQYTSPQKGLEEFAQYSKLNHIIDNVGSNPLPAVFSLTPTMEAQTPEGFHSITNKIKQIPNVQLVQLNMTWLKRLYYLITFSQRIVIALGAIFSCGVVLIVGNTIRLVTQRHQEDINIMRLFGAKPGFIRRPLLYRGVLLGFFGGSVAWVLTALFLWWLASPLEALTKSFSNPLIIQALTIKGGAYLCLSGMLFAGAGAWFAVSPYLRQSEE